MVALVALNSFLVAIVTIIHYEFLYRMSSVMQNMPIRHRFRVLVCVFGALIAHALEIWIFAFGYFLMNRVLGWGSLLGSGDGSLLDCGYFSFTTYTTIGFGDIVPSGSLRYLAGIEALTGLVLITWTASFLYIEMQCFWDDK
jgi:hypothetical protein